MQNASNQATTSQGIALNVDGTVYSRVYSPPGESLAIQAGTGPSGLSNAVVIDQKGGVTPGTGGTQNFGASNLYWGTGYINSLYLKTNGGTGSAFNYYEEYTISVLTFGFNESAPSVGISIVRTGSNVTMRYAGMTGPTNSNASSIGITSGYPSRFNPTNDLTFLSVAYSNNGSSTTTNTGTVVVSHSGGITFYQDLNNTAFGNWTYAGWTNGSLTWPVI